MYSTFTTTRQRVTWSVDRDDNLDSYNIINTDNSEKQETFQINRNNQEAIIISFCYCEATYRVFHKTVSTFQEYEVQEVSRTKNRRMDGQWTHSSVSTLLQIHCTLSVSPCLECLTIYHLNPPQNLNTANIKELLREINYL